MGDVCKYCANKNACEKCDKNWKDMFIPTEDVKEYFNKGYVGVRGMHGYIYTFDTTSESLVPTHSITIGNTHYCPYCGDVSYTIQNKETLAITGHCCICEGAKAEIEYEKKKRELEKEYEEKLSDLQNSYAKPLSFDVEKLLEIKHREERESVAFFREHQFHNHFETINGKRCTDIHEIIR